MLRRPVDTMMTKQEALSGRLGRFNETRGVRGSAIVTRDGLPLVSALPHGVNSESFAALIATAVGAAETAAAEMDPSTARRMSVTFERVRLVVMDAGPEVVIAVVLEGRSDDAALLYEMDALSKEIQEIL